MIYNPEKQYRCTIIRGKAQTELDNLLPAYSNIVEKICPCKKSEFDNLFNESLSNVIYKRSFADLLHNKQKTIRNHITEIAGKLFGLYYFKDGIAFESECNHKLLSDNDQPAFFKNLCLNFQFPNATQKIQTIIERIENEIKFKPFHFILATLFIAGDEDIVLTKDEISYYILNAKQVLQGLVSPTDVLSKIKSDKANNITKKVPLGSKHTQHIHEQLNLLALANLIIIDRNEIILNREEEAIIEYFIQDLNNSLNFDIYDYDVQDNNSRKLMYEQWSEYFGKVSVVDYKILETRVKALQRPVVVEDTQKTTGIDKNALGDEGENYVLNVEKDRVKQTHPRLVNKVLFLGNQRGLGYDISSIEANENKEEPEFARFIEVKSTKRITAPNLADSNWVDTINLTRKEWIAAKQYGTAYNIYRVYFTPQSTIVRRINDPFDKNESGVISVLPTQYRMDFGASSIDLEY